MVLCSQPVITLKGSPRCPVHIMKQNNNVNQYTDAVQRGHCLSGDAPLPFPVFKLAPFCPLSQLKMLNWRGGQSLLTFK